MNASGKPAGYSTVSPYLVVEDADASIRFMKTVFDAEELRRFPARDGGVLHAEVRIGDSIVMIGTGNEGWPPAPCHVHVYVADVDEAYQRALAAGGTSVQEPKQQEGNDDRRGGVRFGSDTTWWIAARAG